MYRTRNEKCASEDEDEDEDAFEEKAEYVLYKSYYDQKEYIDEKNDDMSLYIGR